jgi:hypothetical protein
MTWMEIAEHEKIVAEILGVWWCWFLKKNQENYN